MVTKDDLIYRQVFTLKDGVRVLLRPLIQDDRQAFLNLFSPTTDDDIRYLRHPVNDPNVVNAWVDALDYDHTLPLVAVVGERIVGVSTLHFHKGPARHRAFVRIFLSKDFRRRGVGSRLIQGVIDLAKRRDIYLLEAEIVSDQHHIIRAFQNFDFEIKTTYEDYFMLPDGDLRDVTHLILRLRAVEDLF
jgi:acetyltransferase